MCTIIYNYLLKNNDIAESYTVYFNHLDCYRRNSFGIKGVLDPVKSETQINNFYNI